ncbi:MAG: M28 family peptidase [Chitinophagaceae bacterium]|nr:M28 family peptidase [Chitinophagaceae bacterium]
MKQATIFLFAVTSFVFSYAQKLNKSDKLTLTNLRTHIMFLADDKLEGRRTGTKGEEMAYQYISNYFEKCGLEPKGSGGWLQPFEVNEGKQILSSTLLILDGENFKLNKDFFPLAWSSNGSVEAVASPGLSETGSPWFWDLKDVLEQNQNNPHFDITTALHEKEKTAIQKGATALFIYNSSAIKDNIAYEEKDRSAVSKIPVVYFNKSVSDKLVKDLSHTWDIKLKTEQGDKIRKGNNVVAYINNNASSTIILGAHFDHLGYGEDHNSRYTGEQPAIHNGADDNASGSAALMELARILKNNGSKKTNYLFIAFSGEELGLYGSKYFTDHPTISLTDVNYMINMDMVGRLNDSSKAITIGGVGTSPAWGSLLNGEKKMPFTIKIDSSGTGPSDHTSFYRKDIPVLFFFTGLHTDYHKPTDDFDKINYNGELVVVNYITQLISRTEAQNKLAFTKTREQQTSTSARFTVSMGIMPDYTYSGAGVRADGVSEGRAAQKAGIKAGDVIVQLGDFSVRSVESYMQALSKFKKGDAAKVKVKRGKDEMVFDVVF